MMIVRSKSNVACLWENGGGASNTGSATVVANSDGSRPHALYINKRGHLSCGEHALIPVEKGMFVVYANHHRGDFNITIHRLDDCVEEELVTTSWSFDLGEWDEGAPVECLYEVIKAAKEKALCYHCREPHFVA